MNRELRQLIDKYPLTARLYNYLRISILPIAKIADYVPKEGTIMDVGCGYGLIDMYLAKTSKKRRVLASELNSKRVEIASAVAADIENVKFVAEDLITNKPNEPIDCILLVDLLHHVDYQSQQGLINSIKQILKEGGKLVIKDMDVKPKFKYYWNLVHDKIMTKGDPLFFIGCKELASSLESQGFFVSRYYLKHPLYAHYLLVCEKKF